MNVVDASGWLGFFAVGPCAEHFAKPIEAVPSLMVPTISLYDAFRRPLQQRSEDEALQAMALMEHGAVIELDRVIAIEGARRAAEHRPPMVNRLILATARRPKMTLWTQDADFKDLDGVKFFPRP